MLTSQEWPGNSPKESEGTAVLMFTTWQAEASDGLCSPWQLGRDICLHFGRCPEALRSSVFRLSLAPICQDT